MVTALFWKWLLFRQVEFPTLKEAAEYLEEGNLKSTLHDIGIIDGDTLYVTSCLTEQSKRDALKNLEDRGIKVPATIIYCEIYDLT
jgi:hypothetical protein